MISKNSYKIIRYLYFKGKAHIRKIAKDLNMQPITVSRILKKIEKKKIVVSTQEANMKYYSLNYSNFETVGLLTWVENNRINELSLRSLVISLMKELKNSDVEFCILYGSAVRGIIKEKSDVDIFFVSNYDNITKICRKISTLTGKDIIPHIVSVSQFRKLLKEKEAFAVNTILKPSNRIFLFSLEKFLKLYT